MKRPRSLALTGALVLLSLTTARADPTILVSFGSSPSIGADGDVHLNVGDSFTIDVLLSGLQTGDQVDSLEVDVAWDSGLLIKPTTPMAGDIVPTSDPTYFFADSTTGDASALYDDGTPFLPSPAAPIGSNGLFFSLQLTAAAAGTGMITFETSPTAFLPGNVEDDPTAGPALSYVIATPVPEPPSSMLLAIGGLVLVAHRCISMRHR